MLVNRWFCAVLLAMFPVTAQAQLKLSGGKFSIGEHSEVSDVKLSVNGDPFVCGQLDPTAILPKADAVHRLLSGDHASGARGFVAALTPDLSDIRWFAVFPAGCIEPLHLVLDRDGSIVVGGKHLGMLGALDDKKENWGKTQGALAKLKADGSQVLWVSPGGPNQGAVTGIDIDRQGRVFFTAGSAVRQASNYILRKNGTTGKNEPWGEAAWCVYLHTNQESLKSKGQFLAFYAKAREQSENGFGFDYDGEGGWGPVQFSMQGFRVGGNVKVLPDGDIIVSSCLQYSFRVNKRRVVKAEAIADGRPKSALDALLDGDAKPKRSSSFDRDKPKQIARNQKAQTDADAAIVKGKSFPAFDYFLARYSADGEVRWSTNLYAPGDSVHTPDQKPIDLTYDPASDSVYVLVGQHGSNLYRFKGDLYGDTGNLTIGWVGKVSAKTGRLQNGWYFQNNRDGNFDEQGRPTSPPYPKLAGNQLRRVIVSQGMVYLAGSGAAQTWTTPGAIQAWPKDQRGGSAGALLSLRGDLSKTSYATCLFADVPGGFRPTGLAVDDRGVLMVGKGTLKGQLQDRVVGASWATKSDASGCVVLRVSKN